MPGIFIPGIFIPGMSIPGMDGIVGTGCAAVPPLAAISQVF
jgi:hypothetical protein